MPSEHEHILTPERFSQMLSISMSPDATRAGFFKAITDKGKIFFIVTSGLHIYFGDNPVETMVTKIEGLEERFATGYWDTGKMVKKDNKISKGASYFDTKTLLRIIGLPEETPDEELKPYISAIVQKAMHYVVTEQSTPTDRII